MIIIIIIISISTDGITPGHRAVGIRPVHLLRAFLLRVLESDFPGDSLHYIDIVTAGLHNKIPAHKIFARGWVAQEPICS